jgi:cell division protein FtsB
MKQLSTLGRRRRAQRRKLFWTTVRLAAGLALLGFFAIAGYEAGRSQNAHLLERQAADLAAAAARELQLTEELATVEDRAARIESQLQSLRLDYAANVPPAEFKPLLDLLRARTRAGVPHERLAFVIEQAGRERNCLPAVETRRLIVRTPVTTVLDNAVAFADRRITVSGDGRPARNEAGEPLDWYDPGAPVTLRFLTITGELSRAAGRLPLVHSVILNDREWLFQATAAAEPGFVDVTAQSCAYP